MIQLLRIGRINYSNVWPIFHFFDEAKFDGEVEFIPQVPSQLNKQMAEGLIDMGPISAFSYAEHADEYLLLPNLSVSAFGNVGSILLFLKKDLEDIKHKKIALANTSATSVNLLKIIMEEFLQGKPEYVVLPPQIDLMMENADAALLIGDEALLASRNELIIQKYKVIDLGAEWLERTNHWMTFAVWAVRKEFVEKEPELLSKVYNEFIQSKEKGKRFSNDIISEAIKSFGGTYLFWENYFNGLSHDFDKEQRKGLEHYFQLATKIGVLKNVPEIKLIDFEKISSHSV